MNRIPSIKERDAERLSCLKDELRLREKYARTPAGFRTAAAKETASRAFAAAKEAFDKTYTCRIAAPYIPAPEPFAGRQRELGAIKEAFASGENTVFLSGIGGIGKSTIARRFARLHAGEYEQILWVMCENGFADAFSSDSALRILPLTWNSERYHTRRRYFLAKLSALREIMTGRRTLLILDNCDFPYDRDMRRVQGLPCHKIITTRILPGTPDGVCIPVQGLTNMAELREFVSLYLPDMQKIPTEEECRRLSERTFSHPLQMKLLLTSGSIPELLPSVPAADFFARPPLSAKERTVLLYLAVLPASGIREDLFRSLCGGDPGIWEALRKLIRRNLIDDQDALRLHPIIRHAVHARFVPKMADCAPLIRNLADLTWNAWEKDYEENIQLEPLVLSVLNAFPAPLPHLALDLDVLVTLLWIQGYFKEALDYSRKLFDVCCGKYGESDERTGFMALRTGAVLQNSGYFRESCLWFERGAEILTGLDAANAPHGREFWYFLSHAHERLVYCARLAGDLPLAMAENRLACEAAAHGLALYPDGIPGSRRDLNMQHIYMLREQSELLLLTGNLTEAARVWQQADKAIRKKTEGFRLNAFDMLRVRILLAEMSSGDPDPVRCGAAAQTGPAAVCETVFLAQTCVARAEHYRGHFSKETLRARELYGDVLKKTGKPGEASHEYQIICSILKEYYPHQKEWRDDIAQKSI